MFLTTEKIRQIFLKFFKNKNHQILTGSSLIPHNDNSLLFTNAGMNQFKQYFLGHTVPKIKNIATIQKCIRVGGKHNDLNNVGFTNRHHTFFEMLGNFSFGDYFKKEAITFAWELLTDIKWFNLDKNKIFITVYYTDKETYNFWLNNIGINPKHIIIIYDNNNQLYNSDNFWQIGDTGLCGPSTEIFYDLGEQLTGNIYQNNLGERFIEIWNIVFIQFTKNINGEIISLPIKSVDTGMGLERISSILQKVNSNYKIDIFQKFIQYIAGVLNLNFYEHNSLNVIADHMRSIIYLISSGIIPDNEKRGYILRKLIRRAINHGKLLGYQNNFLYKLVHFYINEITFKEDKKYLKEQYNFIKNIIHNEENNFNLILNKGTILLNNELKKLKNNILDGHTIFYLYDTFGISLDIIKNICQKKNVQIDYQQFKIYLNKQQQRSRENSNFKNKINIYYKKQISKFIGYSTLSTKSIILNIYINGIIVSSVNKGNTAEIILDYTPFYGESGGQKGDIGYLYKNKKNIFQVINTTINGNIIIHTGIVIQGIFYKDDNIIAEIDIIYRNKISKNHTATHLLNYSLRKILGNVIQQKGSLITEKSLRFDFSYLKKITQEQIQNIENIVNHYIFNNYSINIFFEKKNNITLNDNIIYLKNEQYDSTVRIIDIGNFSKELCCGTHVSTTCELGLFKIIKVLNIAHGIKRIHAITHNYAIEYIQKQNNIIKNIVNIFKIDEKNIIEYINKYRTKNNILQQKLKELELYMSKEIMKKILKNNIILNNINIFISGLYTFNPELFNYILKNIISKFNKTIIVLSTQWNKKIFIFIKITKNIININAVNILKKHINHHIIKVIGDSLVAKAIMNINEDEYYIFISKIRTSILNTINSLY
ncbi:alanine--tRNA ligase [Enterobacteriaceae endosymbiont of Neohaemonia nigricornis]|uniref:alanine--tRNA ligase n=1 Tax=Enterobacteriaceae endosymbiont of Neohaemonia nigricornis TaxID=2675792 RepID=UPI00144930D4|nr:alanine--tRNA ligase [Enterobacteriaceae endosymbiont of Neohaemonia nigricornis]QJC30238.1 alanine--tRNA ligase [Enterobacteriaceae endosymbiont of Neohaemonia nigricornis]